MISILHRLAVACVLVAIATPGAAQTLYVTDGPTIKRVVGETAEVVISGLVNPADLAVHDGRIYWSDFGSGKIQRAHLDSLVVEDLVAGVDNPRGIAVDPVGLKVYWAALGSDRIERANLDGTGRQTVISLAPAWNLWDVFYQNGQVYFTDFGGDRIARTVASGGGPAEFVPVGLNPVNPRGIALDEGGMLYWSYVDFAEAQNRIYSVMPWGGAPNVLVPNAGRPFYIELHDGRLYWVDEGIIRYADTDGQETGQIGPTLGAGGSVAVGGPLHRVRFSNVRPAAVPRHVESGTLGDQNAVAAMVAADGTEATEIVVTSEALARTLPASALDVAVAERAALGDGLAGTLGTPVHDAAAGTLTVRYTHPRHVDTPTLYRELTLRVVVDGDTLGTYPVHVYRPPVLMVHGIWGYPNLWDPMEADLVASGRWLSRYMRKMDYSLSHAHPFAYNQRLLGMELRILLGDVVRQGLSASQVDVVTHSMGGVLTRLHVQDPRYPTYANVNRLIAHNTPHSGSQAATMLTLTPSAQAFMDLQDLDQGAVGDLAHDSPATTIDLNGPGLNRHTVPTHSVVTTWTTPDVPIVNPIPGLGGTLVGALFYAAVPAFGCDYSTTNSFVTALFAGEPSDLIVSESSQRGGLAGSSVTANLPEQWHVGSVQTQAAIGRTRTLLEADPEFSPLFTLTGVQPPTLGYQIGLCESAAQRQNRPVSDGSVMLTLPASGSTVAPGETVTVTVTGDPDLTQVMYAAGGSRIPTQWDGGPGNSGSYSFVVPASAAGRLPVVALGFGPGGVSADSVYIVVSVPGGLDSLQVTPGDVPVEANTSRAVVAVGYFSDGVTRVLSGVPGVEYEVSDPTVASVSGGGVTGLVEGTTVLTARYRGLAAHAVVTVFPPAPVSAEPPPADENRAEGIRLRSTSPNPTGGRARIAFDLARDSELVVEVFDLLGRRLVVAGAGARAAGAATVDLDVRGLNAGVYLYRLTALGDGTAASATGRLTVAR